jgi:hypothetical protein
MHILQTLLSPPVLGILALFLSALWMLRDTKDKTRPLLVFALVLNLFYGFLLTTVMGGEGGLFPGSSTTFSSVSTTRWAFRPLPLRVLSRALCVFLSGSSTSSWSP